MVLNEELIADASFYICFLDCIEKSDQLIKILDSFKFHIPPKVAEEIKNSKNWSKISEHRNLNYFFNPPFDVGKIIQPFLSEQEIKKGEYEIILSAYFFYNFFKDKKFFLIIDDKKPRNFIKNSLTELKPFLFGTVDFIKVCCLDYQILNKEETISLYNEIEKSNFRIKLEILNELKKEICQK